MKVDISLMEADGDSGTMNLPSLWPFSKLTGDCLASLAMTAFFHHHCD